MQSCYAVFYIQIGKTTPRKAVIITSPNKRTFFAILKEAAGRKGLDRVGVIDCHWPEVIIEIENRRESGMRIDTITLISDTEIEIYDENCQGPIQVLVYLPNLKQMKHFQTG
ncbi:MAG: hypothetical protein WBV93_07060 [Anaerobacillus sp.]